MYISGFEYSCVTLNVVLQASKPADLIQNFAMHDERFFRPSVLFLQMTQRAAV
jgi:hypothetical protein